MLAPSDQQSQKRDGKRRTEANLYIQRWEDAGFRYFAFGFNHRVAWELFPELSTASHGDERGRKLAGLFCKTIIPDVKNFFFFLFKL